ncbi:MAG: hypothetical protein RIG84_08370 [Roseovarius sp.]
MRHTVFAAALLAPLAAVSPGLAAEGCFGTGQPLLHCTAGSKALDICLQDNVALYRFGPSDGPAEMLLARHVTALDMVPWNGVGRTLWEEITFRNGSYAYAVNYAIDRLAENGPEVSGGVTVSEGDREIARFDCESASMTFFDFYPVYEAKEAAGQCWSREAGLWGPC